jgi:predicted enzyme related to lactoylglutathione lyase
MPAVVHFEIPADDIARAKGFYESLFDWKFEQFPDMEYWSIKTGDGSGPGGGMMARRDRSHGITNYIDVTSVDEYGAKVQQLGGKVIVAKTAVPAMGYFAVCLDTEGNPFGIWETDPNAG